MTEKRSQGRLLTQVKVTAEVEYSQDSSLTVGEKIDCQTRDLSLAGICIESSVQFSTDSRLKLAIIISPPDTVFNILSQVVWCRESDAGFMSGLHVTQYLCDEDAWRNAVIKILSG